MKCSTCISAVLLIKLEVHELEFPLSHNRSRFLKHQSKIFMVAATKAAKFSELVMLLASTAYVVY